ncbi:hypothetical protein KN815_49735, partial [Streptomyces sp. 4503]|nr:hypothetical protein [Streptomyces niphimycinicus]
LGAAAKRVAQPVPVWRAYAAMLQAERERAEGRDRPDLWAEATDAFAALDRPYPLARARHRWAEALLTSGQGASPAQADREHAAGLLVQAYAVAEWLGARPLREEIELLARRARLPLASAATRPALDAALPRT